MLIFHWLVGSVLQCYLPHCSSSASQLKSYELHWLIYWVIRMMDRVLDDAASVGLNWFQFINFDSENIFEPEPNAHDGSVHDTTGDIDLQSDIVVPPLMEDFGLFSSLTPIQLTTLLPETPNSSHVPLVAEEPLEYRSPSRHVLPAPDQLCHDNDGYMNASSELHSLFEQAICAVQNDRKRKLSPPNSYQTGFNTFRVNLGITKKNPNQARTKKNRLKRSVTRPCLLCRVLKLKCSPGRPCARCIEKHMGQEDLGFTSCLRDNPSKFNPFTSVHRHQGSFYDDIHLQCMTAYRMGYLSNSPLLFIMAISYTCYYKSTYHPSVGIVSSSPSAISLCGSYMQQISQIGFQELERALTSRDANQSANHRGRLLTIALSLYAWLGSDSAGQLDETRSEMEATCKQYLSEYIDLLISHCIPGVPGATIRHLMWTMHNLIVFPALPQLNFGSDAIHKVYDDAQQAVFRTRKMLLRSMSDPSPPVWGNETIRQEYSKNYWPHWDHHQDDHPTHLLRLWPLLGDANKMMILWSLRLKRSESFDPIVNDVTQNSPGGSNPASKSFLEWMEDTRRMLLRN